MAKILTAARDALQKPTIIRFVECYVDRYGAYDPGTAWEFAPGAARDLISNGTAYQPTEAEDLLVAKAQIQIRQRTGVTVV